MGKDNVVISSCSHDYGGGCMLKLHLSNGKVVRIETDDGEEPQFRA